MLEVGNTADTPNLPYIAQAFELCVALLRVSLCETIPSRPPVSTPD